MLTDNEILRAQVKKKPFKLSDGKGLSLQVRPTGARVWLRHYRFQGKARTETIGTYPEVTIQAARVRSREIAKNLAIGADPSLSAGIRRQARPYGKPQAKSKTPLEARFDVISDRYFRKREVDGAADATLLKLKWNLAVCKDYFGGRDISTVRPSEVYDLINRIQETGKSAKAVDVYRRLVQIFDFAVALDLTPSNVARQIKPAVSKPKSSNLPGLIHEPEVGALLRAINGYKGTHITRAALQLSAHCVLRSGELRASRWADIDLKKRLWRVPKPLTKMKRSQHIVPLSTQAWSVLYELHKWTPGCREADFVFPAMGDRSRHLSDATLNAALRRMGYDTSTEHCQHGFRTTFSTNMNEKGWNRDWIEAQLGHADTNAVRGAYYSAIYLENRRKLMQAYSDWLSKISRIG